MQLRLNLFILGGVFVVVGSWSLLWVVNGFSWVYVVGISSWLVVSNIGDIVLRHVLPKRDRWVYWICALLAGWSSVLVVRLAPAFGIRQVTWVFISTAACVSVALICSGSDVLRRQRLFFLVTAAMLVVSTYIVGASPSGFGPNLWLRIGEIYFQPAELLKIATVNYVSHHIFEEGRQSYRLWMILAIIVGACGLVVLQGDLGSGVIIFASCLVILHLVGMPSSMGLIVIAFVLCGGVVLYSISELLQARLLGWLAPRAGADSFGFQIIQGWIAMASGGLVGSGFGFGMPTAVPVVHSDFIFVAIVEEYGVIGGAVVLLAFVGLLGRLFYMTVVAGFDGSSERTGMAIAVVFVVQFLAIVGGVLGVIPLTGVTLPFLSYGGSSLLISFIMIGVWMRISHDMSIIRL